LLSDPRSEGGASKINLRVSGRPIVRDERFEC